MTNREQLTKTIKKFGLHADDVYVHETGYKAIKRRGYKRIQAQLGIEIEFECPHASLGSAVVLAKGHTQLPPLRRQTLGEASPRNTTFPYPVAVAQKRAEGRLILEMANLVEDNWLTEDEIDHQIQTDILKEKMADIGKKSVQAVEDLLGKKDLPVDCVSASAAFQSKNCKYANKCIMCIGIQVEGSNDKKN